MSGWFCVANLHTKQSAWQRSKACLGPIGPVDRIRVADMANPDPERPLSPGHRATCPLLYEFVSSFGLQLVHG